MTIAEKILRAKSDYDAVYEAGKNAGGGGGQGSYDEGYEAGRKAEYDEFWDAFQENGQRTMYVEGFCRQGWNAVTYNPKYPIIGVLYGLQSLFSNSYIEDTKVPITLRGGNTLKAIFNGCTRLIYVPSLILEVPATDCASAFNNCPKLEEITISCVGEGCIAGTTDVRTSTKLSKASIESIMAALSTTTSGLTVTLSKTAVNNAFTKEEWEALVSQHTNWNISLI